MRSCARWGTPWGRANRAGPGRGTRSLHSGASFVDTKLDHADFSEAILDGTDFSYSALRCTNFAGADVSHSVLLYPVNVSPAPGCRTNFGDNARLTQLEIRTIGIGTPNRINWPLVNFNNVQVARLDNTAVSFDHLDMSKAQLARADLDGLSFTASNLSGAVLHQARLNHADFSESADDGADFSGADLESANFNCAQLYGSGQWKSGNSASVCSTHYNLSGAITNAETNFDNARLKDAQFSGAMLDHARFRFATMTRANFNGASLRGSHMSSDNYLEPAKVVNASF